jgi:tetratricopeptide (TPR) repeat protein
VGKAVLLLSLAILEQDYLSDPRAALSALLDAHQLVGSSHSESAVEVLSPRDIWLQAFLCRLLSRIGSAYRLVNDMANAVKFGLKAHQRASQFRGTALFRSLRASVTCLLGIAYRYNGQLQEAYERVEQAVDLFEGVNDLEPGRSRLQWATAELIRIHLARQELLKAQRLLATMHTYSRTSVCSGVGFYRLAFEYFKELLYVPENLFRSDITKADRILKEAEQQLAEAEQLLLQPHTGRCRCERERVKKSRVWLDRKKVIVLSKVPALSSASSVSGMLSPPLCLTSQPRASQVPSTETSPPFQQSTHDLPSFQSRHQDGSCGPMRMDLPLLPLTPQTSSLETGAATTAIPLGALGNAKGSGDGTVLG